jgi:DNA-directed RNA polymerase subunit RPC12/RpoP
MSDGLFDALQRAAQRVSSQAAKRSLAEILPPPTAARTGRDLPPVQAAPGPLRIAPGERWCQRCGMENPGGNWGHHDVGDNDRCQYCGSTRLVEAIRVLRPEEYTCLS